MNIELVKELLEKYGEIHLYVEEHEAITGDEEHIGIRNGDESVDFDDSNSAIVIDDGRKPYYLDYDSIILVTPAKEFPD